ncbi:hypothetical protein F66182_4360 [Fusarium sp. NRRL 66182]|nr:hypothetical protein F66182_4360 [Fusarium sp. NRRL 66182]
MATGVDARLVKSTKFPPEFSQKVDMQKVNLQVMKKWIASKISEILGSEDDVVIELVFNLIEGPRYPDIKSLQIQLTGFLDKDTATFCKDLWKLLLSAQSSPQGVPKELLEAKKLELMQEKTATAETGQLLVEIPGKGGEVTVTSKATGAEEGSEGEVVDRALQALASVTQGIHTGAIAMFREADMAVGGLTLGDEHHLLDHVPHQHYLNQVRGVVARRAAPINPGEDLYPQEDKKTDERDRDHLGETNIGGEQIATIKEAVLLNRLDLFLQTDIPLHGSADGTPPREAAL